ncbi:MAG: glyoxylate carboligase [candidate division NC10 bacterium RIFCSPLOWO2_12_FULL_66_18]|nr:MAG: glyoxylate carboligase [candidate division NC10 bacterium RIFCSPLOWO2_12_FULL_66_18]
MPKMPVMEAVVKILEDEGVDVVFGIPGAAILPLYKALTKSQKIRHLTVRHEEGATHAADGWARVTGKVGVAIGTSGPAGTNMITGLYTCQGDSIPIVCITGQAVRPILHKEAFQAVNIAEIAKPVTKKTYCVLETAQIPQVFREAFKIAREGRPGPVLIDLPLDVQRGEVEYDPAIDAPLEVFKPSPDIRKIRRAVEMLLQAQRPILMMGGGVMLARACEEFVALAEHLQIPVIPTYMAMGGIPADHPLYGGMVGIQTSTRGGNKLFLESDVVLCIGNRFADRHTGDVAVYRGERKFIHIDIEPTQLGKVFPPDLGIVADAKLAVEALLRVAREMTPRRTPSPWSQKAADYRRRFRRKMDFDQVPVKPQRVFKELNEFFNPDTIFVTAIGLYQIWSGQFQEIYKPGTYFCCGQAGPLGWEVPACIGVKLGKPDAQVVGVVGDYSFQFLLGDLATAVQNKVPYVLVMLNNGYLSLIRQPEKYLYEMNYGVDIGYDDGYGPDFVKIMEGMKALGKRVLRPEEIKPALEWAVRESNRLRVPALVEIRVDRETDASMGASIDKIVERDPVIDLPAEEPVATTATAR